MTSVTPGGPAPASVEPCVRPRTCRATGQRCAPAKLPRRAIPVKAGVNRQLCHFACDLRPSVLRAIGLALQESGCVFKCGDHICSLYSTPAELGLTVDSFLADGGERRRSPDEAGAAGSCQPVAPLPESSRIRAGVGIV